MGEGGAYSRVPSQVTHPGQHGSKNGVGEGVDLYSWCATVPLGGVIRLTVVCRGVINWFGYKGQVLTLVDMYIEIVTSQTGVLVLWGAHSLCATVN